jgi:N-acetylneuraminate lyase
MTNTSAIGGVWPALFTPVAADGSPAYSELEKMVQLCLNQQLDGIYLLGSTGQGVLFSEKERTEITRQTMNVVGTALPVIVQVGAFTTSEAVRLAQIAQDAGAYGISSVAPIYYQGGVQNSLAHYRAISSSVAIPFFPYHVGNQSIFGGDARSYIDQLLALPNIKGMKLTTQNLYEVSLMHILAGEELLLFSGADELFCQAALSGTVGAIGSFFNLWGAECQYVRKEFIAGNFELGSRFMLAFQEVINQVLPNVWTFFQKSMYLQHGIDIGLPRAPLGVGNKEEWSDQEVHEILDRIAVASGMIRL